MQNELKETLVTKVACCIRYTRSVLQPVVTPMLTPIQSVYAALVNSITKACSSVIAQ